MRPYSFISNYLQSSGWELAKALEGETPPASELSQSPTLTAAATQAGVILGTAAYMSPEQARGKPTDRRADIWAIGVVLFEMLSGKRSFEGEDVSLVLAHVLSHEPNWEKLPADLSPRLRDLLERCLRKDPTLRVQAVGDVRITLQEYLADPSGVLVQPTGDVVQAQPQSKLPWGAALILAVITGVAGWNLRPVPSPESPSVTRFYDELSEELGFRADAWPNIAISPDGSQLAYNTSAGLSLRSMDELESRIVSGTEEP